MENNYKEVYYGAYCSSCKHKNQNEDETPCDECLENNTNLHSHKPINYEENK